MNLSQLGGEGKVVEADEPYVGGLEKNKHMRKRLPNSHGGATKQAVFSMVERGGRVRSFHTGRANMEILNPIIKAQLHRRTVLLTDEASFYYTIGKQFAAHQVVAHTLGQYVCGEVHTNTIEGYFSVFKRGMKGTYQHCSKRHLKRYLSEFDFRYNYREGLGYNDQQRSEELLQGIKGKRLKYRH